MEICSLRPSFLHISNTTSYNEVSMSVKEPDVLKTFENCCSNTSIYEITYNHIEKTWLVCNLCLELDFFKTGINNKVRIQR